MVLSDIAKKELADYYKEYRAKNKDKLKVIQNKAQQKFRDKKKLEQPPKQERELKEEVDPIKLKKREYNKRYYDKKKQNNIEIKTE